MLVALHTKTLRETRTDGWRQDAAPWIIYASDQTHQCLQACLEILGLGRRSLHLVASDEQFRIDVRSLTTAIQRDRACGLRPLCLVGNAGTTNTGAIDQLGDLANLCVEEDLWFHIDGAYGAFGVLDACVAPRYEGMERADSLSLDGHKWLGIPYECGCFFVRKKTHLEATFAASQPAYRNEPGTFHFTDWSYQLSRAFHALKVWMMLVSTGKQPLAARIHRHNQLARLLVSQIDQSADFERLAPVTLSTVCFRYIPPGVPGTDDQWNQLNQQILERVQHSGTLMLSGTLLRGRLALRACIVHAQTTEEDITQILPCIRQVLR